MLKLLLLAACVQLPFPYDELELTANESKAIAAIHRYAESRIAAIGRPPHDTRKYHVRGQNDGLPSRPAFVAPKPLTQSQREAIAVNVEKIRAEAAREMRLKVTGEKRDRLDDYLANGVSIGGGVGRAG